MKERPISFLAGMLGEGAFNLAVLAALPGAVLLEKPAGVAGDSYPWNPTDNSLVEALRDQLVAGKPALIKAGWQTVRSVFPLEAELSGAVLVVTQTERVDFYRNEFGSHSFEFVFHLLVEKGEVVPQDELLCELPVMPERLGAPQLVVSHRYGKQAKTQFKRLENLGHWELWEARTTYPRVHQIRLHASEVGVKITGERVYTQVPLIAQRLLKTKGPWKGEAGAAAYDHLGAHLAQLNYKDQSFAIPYPSKLEVLLRKLRQKI